MHNNNDLVQLFRLLYPWPGGIYFIYLYLFCFLYSSACFSQCTRIRSDLFRSNHQLLVGHVSYYKYNTRTINTETASSTPLKTTSYYISISFDDDDGGGGYCNSRESSSSLFSSPLFPSTQWACRSAAGARGDRQGRVLRVGILIVYVT